MVVMKPSLSVLLILIYVRVISVEAAFQQFHVTDDILRYERQTETPNSEEPDFSRDSSDIDKVTPHTHNEETTIIDVVNLDNKNDSDFLISNPCNYRNCYTDYHVVCNRDVDQWEINKLRKCPSAAKWLALKVLRRFILAKINSWRNKVAGGFYKLPTAARMGRVLWDTKLAKLAQYKLIDCLSSVDSCRSIDLYEYPAQVIQKLTWAVIHRPNRLLISDIIDKWMDEERHLMESDVRNYTLSVNRNTFPDATLLLEANNRVGCACIHYPEYGHYNLIFVCNFPSVPWINEPIYEIGPVGSKCKTMDYIRLNLCHPMETYTRLTTD